MFNRLFTPALLTKEEREWLIEEYIEALLDIDPEANDLELNDLLFNLDDNDLIEVCDEAMPDCIDTFNKKFDGKLVTEWGPVATR